MNPLYLLIPGAGLALWLFSGSSSSSGKTGGSGSSALTVREPDGTQRFAAGPLAGVLRRLAGETVAGAPLAMAQNAVVTSAGTVATPITSGLSWAAAKNATMTILASVDYARSIAAPHLLRAVDSAGARAQAPFGSSFAVLAGPGEMPLLLAAAGLALDGGPLLGSPAAGPGSAGVAALTGQKQKAHDALVAAGATPAEASALLISPDLLAALGATDPLLMTPGLIGALETADSLAALGTAAAAGAPEGWPDDVEADGLCTMFLYTLPGPTGAGVNLRQLVHFALWNSDPNTIAKLADVLAADHLEASQCLRRIALRRAGGL